MNEHSRAVSGEILLLVPGRLYVGVVRAVYLFDGEKGDQTGAEDAYQNLKLFDMMCKK